MNAMLTMRQRLNGNLIIFGGAIVKSTNSPYEDLANAIVLKAVEDYREALRVLSLNPNNNDAVSEVRSIERFFRSGYFGILTKLDPEMLIERLNEEATV